MKLNIQLVCGVGVAMLFALPLHAVALQQRVFTGIITAKNVSGFLFSGSSGITYSVDIAGANLVRKNGSSMLFSEFILGDKIEVRGTLWGDNSISASSIRDLSLYAHTGTFSGKIISLDPATQSFTVQSSQPLQRNIHTTSLTSLKKNGGSATFQDLQIGMSVSVKGFWERQAGEITASAVQATLRLVNIQVTGQITLVLPNALTVVSSGTIYGVDISKAVLKKSDGSVASINSFTTGDMVRVTGKHVSGKVQITASSVKKISVAK